MFSDQMAIARNLNNIIYWVISMCYNKKKCKVMTLVSNLANDNDAIPKRQVKRKFPIFPSESLCTTIVLVQHLYEIQMKLRESGPFDRFVYIYLFSKQESQC